MAGRRDTPESTGTYQGVAQWWSMGKSEDLGMPFGTACGRLRKLIMFDMCRRLGEHICFRCGTEIEDISQFTIEHKVPWSGAEDAVEKFFSLDNISFSHHACNVAAARKPTRKFTSREEQKAECFRRHYADPEKRARLNARRNARRRKQQRPEGEPLGSP